MDAQLYTRALYSCIALQARGTGRVRCIAPLLAVTRLFNDSGQRSSPPPATPQDDSKALIKILNHIAVLVAQRCDGSVSSPKTS